MYQAAPGWDRSRLVRHQDTHSRPPPEPPGCTDTAAGTVVLAAHRPVDTVPVALQEDIDLLDIVAADPLQHQGTVHLDTSHTAPERIASDTVLVWDTVRPVLAHTAQLEDTPPPGPVLVGIAQHGLQPARNTRMWGYRHTRALLHQEEASLPHLLALQVREQERPAARAQLH